LLNLGYLMGGFPALTTAERFHARVTDLQRRRYT
jgi:hypothetical protein